MVPVAQDVDTVDEAVQQLRDKGFIQPLLFTFQGRHWIKLDNKAVVLHESCIADAFETLLQYFFAFNVCYPAELWLVYGFLERVMGLKATVGKSVTLSDFAKHVL